MMPETLEYQNHAVHAHEVVIRVRNLVTRFGSQVVHDGVNLDVYRGEVLGVVGGSGSGKSVLLKEIIGLMRPAQGTVEILGQDTHDLSDAAWKKLQARCGILFQEGALFSSMTVAENIAAPLKEYAPLPPDLIQDIVHTKIKMVGLSEDAGAKYPSQLSGGMRKRAALSRALALDPEILFLDEPTAGLDPIGAGAFDTLIRNLQKSLGLTVFMVTHDLDSLVTICDRIAVLVDKKIKVGTLQEMLQDTHPWIHEYFQGPRGRAVIERQK